MTVRTALPVAIIGAGFSGSMVAVHLLRRLPAHCPILLFERSGAFARGAAYSTHQPLHLLNVRAAQMSAFPDLPDDFRDWLGRAAAADATVKLGDFNPTDAGRFAARMLFGRYLGDTLEAVADDARLYRIAAEVVDIAPAEGGYRLTRADGQAHLVSSVVFALGNLTASQPSTDVHVTNPWAWQALDGLDVNSHLPLLVVGSGLTMVDIAVELQAAGYPGQVIALSRRGLLPQRHAATAAWPTPDLSAEAGSVPRLLRRLRAEVARAVEQGVDWRGVMDSLRPLTVGLWQGLPPAERARFLRHVRPWWDTHRHRIAPPVGDRIDAMRAAGQLDVRAGRVLAMEPLDGRMRVTWRPRGAAEAQVMEVRRVIDAAGVASLGRAQVPLLKALLDQGLARTDPQRLGLDTTPELRLLDAGGAVRPGLWALGPMVRGVFWECTAVPDIRGQAESLAAGVAAEVA